MTKLFPQILFIFFIGFHLVKGNQEYDHKNVHHDFPAFTHCLLSNGCEKSKLVERDLQSDVYNKLNKPWNIRLELAYPLAYFLPTITQDVVSIVKCGSKFKVQLMPNSGGHSYEGISWGTNHTVVVDFRNMAKMVVGETGQNAVAYLQPGANLAHINTFLWENGGYGFPAGNCLTVGIGGHAIGGGVGYYSGLYGLALDNVLEVEIVDGLGNIVVANEHQNEDLYWALRGSGPGYIGIVTRYKVKLFEASRLKLTFAKVHYTVENFAMAWIALQKFQTWVKENEPLATFFGLTITSDFFNQTLPALPPGILLQAVHLQHPEDQPQGNENFLQAISKFFPSPALILPVLEPNYIQFVVMTGYAPVILPNPVTGQDFEVGKIDNYFGPFPTGIPSTKESLEFLKLLKKEDAAPRYFKAKSFFTKRKFTLPEMQLLQNTITRIPAKNIWLLVNTEEGKIATVSRTATAYVHRTLILDITIQYEGSADPGQAVPGMEYLYELFDTMKFMDGGETYQNYPDLDIIDHLQRNYKENLGRLIHVKRKWDPKNYFHARPLSLP